MPKNEVISWDNGESHYELEIVRANGYIAAKRAMLHGQALIANEKEQDEIIAFARFVMYPDFIAPVVRTTGFVHWPVTLEEFLELDEELLVLWSGAIYRANPHWQAIPNQEQAIEKKEITPSEEHGVT